LPLRHRALSVVPAFCRRFLFAGAALRARPAIGGDSAGSKALDKQGLFAINTKQLKADQKFPLVAQSPGRRQGRQSA